MALATKDGPARRGDQQQEGASRLHRNRQKEQNCMVADPMDVFAAALSVLIGICVALVAQQIHRAAKGPRHGHR
jgi:hypothetical protein